jgi:O-antigen/teichoic acid export membrane protein
MLKEKLIKNTFWGVSELIVAILVGLILPRIFLLNAGREAYGLFLTLTLFSTYGVLTMLDFGMGGAAMTFVAKYHASDDSEKLGKLWSFALLYYTCTALLAVAVGLVIIGYYDTSITAMLDTMAISHRVLVPTLLMVAVAFLSYQCDSFLFGFNDYSYVKRVTIIQNILRVGIIAVALKAHSGFELIMWMMATLSLIRFALLMGLIKNRYGRYTVLTKFSWEDAREWFGYSIVLLISSLTGFIFNSFNRVLISIFLPIAAMSDFDVASKPQTLIRGLLSALNSAVMPASAHYQSAGNKEKLRELFMRGSNWLHMILLPPLVFITLMMNNFVLLWLGPSQLSVVIYAQTIISYLFVLNLPGALANVMLVGMGEAKRYIPVQIAASILNIAISFATVSHYGIKGLIFALVFGNIVANTGMLFVFAKTLEFEATDFMSGMLSSYFKLLTAALLPVVPLVVFKVTLPIGGFATLAIAYCALMYWIYFTLFMNSEEQAFFLSGVAMVKEKIYRSA